MQAKVQTETLLAAKEAHGKVHARCNREADQAAAKAADKAAPHMKAKIKAFADHEAAAASKHVFQQLLGDGLSVTKATSFKNIEFARVQSDVMAHVVHSFHNLAAVQLPTTPTRPSLPSAPHKKVKPQLQPHELSQL